MNTIKEMLHKAKEEAQKQNFQVAAQLLEKVLKQEPENIHALDLMGFVLYFQGYSEKALICCDKALAIDSKHVYALKGKGICLASLGKVEEGINSLKEAISIDPQYCDARLDLAVILSKNQMIEQAIASLENAEKELLTNKKRITSLKEKLLSKYPPNTSST